jgi:glycosyltransferase involved in cell wall biosynthesis
MTKNVLLISDHGDPLAPLGGRQAGGQNNYVRNLSLALEKLGYTVDVVTHWSDPAAPRTETFSARCRVIRISAGRKKFLSKNAMYEVLPAFYDEMTRTLSIGSYDLIHTHYWLSGLLGERLQREYGVPFVHTSHSLAKAKQLGTGKLDTRRFAAERHVIRSAEAVIATTPYEQDLLYSFEPDCAPTHVIPCGVNDIFQPTAQADTEDQTATFLYVGRLVEEKGIFTLLSAFRDFVTRGENRPEARLIVAGGDKASVDLKKHLPRDRQLKKYLRGLEDSVKFVGPQSQETLVELYSNATATIVPSYYESFGMVAAESLACGTPVIASRTGGLQHVVEHGTTGLLIEPRNAEHLSSMMGLMTSSKRFPKILGHNGVRVANEQFRWDAIAQQVDELYTEVGQGAPDRVIYQ